MLFAVICKDKPDSLELRLANRPDHVDFLKGLGSSLKLAGPFTSEDGEGMDGSLLIVEAESQAAAEAMVANDPYAGAGLFASTEVKPWKLVINGLEG